MSSQEVLLSGDNVTDDDGRAKREDDVLIVWVENESLVNLP